MVALRGRDSTACERMIFRRLAEIGLRGDGAGHSSILDDTLFRFASITGVTRLTLGVKRSVRFSTE